MRRIAAVLLGLLAAPSALAGGEACILTGTHTIMGGKKPPIITLRLDCGTSPSDAERLKPLPFRSGTKIEADPEVAPGDVHVTTPHGVLVRDQDEVLEAIRNRIRGELGE